MNQEQFDFDPAAHHRHSDPSTSRAASYSMEGIAEGLCLRLLAAFKSAGPMTRAEAARMVQLSEYQTSKRLSDLKNKGLVRDSGSTRPGPSGRQQTVWEAV